MTDNARTVLVLGGGVGGVVAAVELKRRLGDSVRAVLVDRDRQHVFPPSALRVATGERPPEASVASLGRLEKTFGVEFVEAEIERIEPEDRAVELAGGRRIEGDQMIVSLGAESAPETIPGLSEAGDNLYSMAGATSFRDRFSDFESGRLAVMTPPGGYVCPPAPYGASMLMESRLRERGNRDAVALDFFAAQPAPVGIAGPDNSANLLEMVESKGISFHAEHVTDEVDPASSTLHFSGGGSAEFDLLGYIPPARAPQVVREAGMTDESGWIPIDRETMETDYEGVFAIGDVTHVPLATGKPRPMAGFFAKGEAQTVAANIAADLEGRSPDATFEGAGTCFIETGDGEASVVQGNFYAEPEPDLSIEEPSRELLWERLAFEKKWFFDWFRKPF